MATTYKVLGQSAPAATTEVDLYTVPAATDAIISTVTVANRGSSSGTFRVYVAAAGAATTDAQYLFFDATLNPKTTLTLTLGVCLAATDVLRIFASTADFSFNAFGTELS